MRKKKDIFDKLMSLRILSIFKPYYKEHKEILLYLFFGGLAFIINMLLFVGLNGYLGINELFANVVAWVICVLFQFFTNRTWVFDGHVNSCVAFFNQMIGFFGGRIATLVVEEFILLIFITWLAFNTTFVKLCAQIIVIILNYVISKVFIFKNKK